MRGDYALDHIHRPVRCGVSCARHVEKIRAAAPDARVIGFASHVDLKPLKAAREAGYELTLSRSEFTARLPELLKAPTR